MGVRHCHSIIQHVQMASTRYRRRQPKSRQPIREVRLDEADAAARPTNPVLNFRLDEARYYKNRQKSAKFLSPPLSNKGGVSICFSCAVTDMGG